VKSRTQVANQVKDIVQSAPEQVRSELRPLTTAQRVRRAAGWAPDPTSAAPLDATMRALRHLALRYQGLTAEMRELNAKLLITAGDNPERLRSDASLAALCGASPVEASSGKVTRHRLNRGGDRQANNALWTIAWHRLKRDPDTQAYADRRTKEGKSEKDILRCLKRYIARELYPLLLHDLQHAATLSC
jgi:transposase